MVVTSLTPDMLLRAYAVGAFPMAEARDEAEIEFYQPRVRGVFVLPQIHVPKRLRRTLRAAPYRLYIDRDFPAVIEGCAQVRKTESSTWINAEIERAYRELHALGHAHCVSAYDASDQLVGGLYGLHLGSAFFGESMFSTARDASKICFLSLCAQLWHAGFEVIDAKMSNPHLLQFGLQEWQNEDFLDQLPGLLERQLPFPKHLSPEALDQFLQLTTQTS